MVSRPTRSGPGKLKNGFNMIARDLDRAFVLALLGTYEAIMLQHVREESWAASLRRRRKGEPMPDPMPCKPNVSSLARQTGLNRRLLARGLGDLTAAKILTRLADGSVRINKDYCSWVYPATDRNPERPRLTPENIAFIGEMESPSEDSDCHSQVAGDAAETATPGYQGVLPVGSSAATHEYQPEETPATPGYQPLVPTGSSAATPGYQSHIEERARGELESKESNNNIIPLTPINSEAAPKRATFDVKDCPPYPDHDGPYMIMGGGDPMDQNEAQRIFRMLWKGFGSIQVCNGFYEHQCWYSPAIWIAAIRKAAKQETKVFSIKFIETIAGSYAVNGIPIDEPPKANEKTNRRFTPKPDPVPGYMRPAEIGPQRVIKSYNRNGVTIPIPPPRPPLGKTGSES